MRCDTLADVSDITLSDRGGFYCLRIEENRHVTEFNVSKAVLSRFWHRLGDVVGKSPPNFQATLDDLAVALEKRDVARRKVELANATINSLILKRTELATQVVALRGERDEALETTERLRTQRDELLVADIQGVLDEPTDA